MHGLEIATRAPTIAADTAAARAITASDENLVIARAFLFGLLPIFAAWRYVAARGLPLERKHLRGPFYGQCYLAAPFVLIGSLSIIAANLAPPALVPVARLVGLASVVWYLTVQTLQYRASLDWPTPRAFGLALRAFLEAVATFIAVALIISYGP